MAHFKGKGETRQLTLSINDTVAIRAEYLCIMAFADFDKADQRMKETMQIAAERMIPVLEFYRNADAMEGKANDQTK